MVDKAEIINKRYKEQAIKWSDGKQSTMTDLIIRQKELEILEKFFRYFVRSQKSKIRILDIGCGNGYALFELSKKFIDIEFTGIDISKELLEIAINRKLKNCEFKLNDCISIKSVDNYYDYIFTERCLINLVSWKDQKIALDEIHRILKPKGYYLMIECFTDGLINNNLARSECGLSNIPSAKFNEYFEKDIFLDYIKYKFHIVESQIQNNYFSCRWSRLSC